jgi:hypothetical protein
LEIPGPTRRLILKRRSRSYFSTFPEPPSRASIQTVSLFLLVVSPDHFLLRLEPISGVQALTVNWFVAKLTDMRLSVFQVVG